MFEHPFLFNHTAKPSLESELLPRRLKYDDWSILTWLPLKLCLSFPPFPIVTFPPNNSFIKYLLSFAIFISIGFVIGLSKFLYFSSIKGVFHCFYLSILLFSEFIFICSIKVYFKFSLSFDDYYQFGLCILIFGRILTYGLNT